MLKKMVMLGCVLVMMLQFIPFAFSEGITDLWVSSDGEKGNDAISWYREENKKYTYYLFLPGNVDISSMKIGFAGRDAITIQGKKVRNGANTDFLKPGGKYTIEAGKKYTLFVMQGSPGYPAIYVATESGRLTKIHKDKANKEPGYLLFTSANGAVEYNGPLKYIKMRGNSSTTFKKKNYQIKLETGTDLAGMGKSKTWVLTGNSRDKSLLRNQITLDMAEYAGLKYTPEHLFAELYINHEYMGLYLFGEKAMVDKDRVAITNLEKATEEVNEKDLSEYSMVGSKTPQAGKYKAYSIPADPDDITGGYLVEFESYSVRYKDNASAYHTTRKNTLGIKSPEYCSEAQIKYISNYLQSFENAIFASDGTDPKSGKHYTELVDLHSLVNKYLIEEVSKNYDGNSSSMFFYKDSDAVDPLMYAGPCWDYDSAYASYAREDNAKKVLTGKKLWIGDATGAKYWWPALYKQQDFYTSMTAQYRNVFRKAMNVLLGNETDSSEKLVSIDEYAEKIKDSAEMNFTRWPIMKNSSTVAKTGNTFEKNISYLKDFLSERKAFLDELWLGETK